MWSKPTKVYSKLRACLANYGGVVRERVARREGI